MAEKDWFAWHADYARPGSSLAARLDIVKGRIRQAVEDAPAGGMRLVSMCAGQGRDVIGALDGHDRRRDVRARLVELDPRNTAVAAELAEQAGLDLEIVTGDASVTEAYIGVTPARIVVACGIFGNISDDDIRRTIRLLPMLCDTGATVIWTRHRRDPDLTPSVRRWFGEEGFEEVGFDSPEQYGFVGVGCARWPGLPGRLESRLSFFDFAPVNRHPSPLGTDSERPS